MRHPFEKGDRVKLTDEAIQNIQPKTPDRHGTVITTPRSQYIGVLWDGRRSVAHGYTWKYLEEVTDEE